jgi:hypothetical protein
MEGKAILLTKLIIVTYHNKFKLEVILDSFSFCSFDIYNCLFNLHHNMSGFCILFVKVNMWK